MKHLGNVTQKTRATIGARILRAFSAVLWLQGAPAPRVEGYEAHIKLAADARPPSADSDAAAAASALAAGCLRRRRTSAPGFEAFGAAAAAL